LIDPAGVIRRATMSDYLLILRQGDSDVSRPQDHAALRDNFFRWTDGLRKSGKLVLVERLGSDWGKTVRKRGGAVVVDGPFPEGKEGIVGLFVVVAQDMDEALAIAQGCPLVAIGGWIEVRKGVQSDG
jgi:hypothetical protein